MVAPDVVDFLEMEKGLAPFHYLLLPYIMTLSQAGAHFRVSAMCTTHFKQSPYKSVQSVSQVCMYVSVHADPNRYIRLISARGCLHGSLW